MPRGLGRHNAALVASAAAALASMLLLSGCGGPTSNAAATASSPVARVGNDVIPMSLFELRVGKTLAGIRQGGGPAQGSPGYAAMVKQVRASVMRSLIIDTVIAHEASFRGLAATDAEVERELANDARAAGGMDKLRQQRHRRGKRGLGEGDAQERPHRVGEAVPVAGAAVADVPAHGC